MSSYITDPEETVCDLLDASERHFIEALQTLQYFQDAYAAAIECIDNALMLGIQNQEDEDYIAELTGKLGCLLKAHKPNCSNYETSKGVKWSRGDE